MLTDGTTFTAVDGDIVIQGEKEFIWIDTYWAELGDLTRIGVLETKVKSLDYSDTYYKGKVVTQVVQTDGKITARKDFLEASDILRTANSNTKVSESLSSI